MEALWQGGGCWMLLPWVQTRVPPGWGVSGGGHRRRTQDRAGVRGATGRQGSLGTCRPPACSEGRQDPGPSPTFPSQPGPQPLSAALSVSTRLGSGGRALSSGLVPAGQQVHPQRIGWLRSGHPTHRLTLWQLHSGRRRRVPGQGPGCPSDPSGPAPRPIPGTGFRQEMPAAPPKGASPGHNFHRAHSSADPWAQAGP